MHVSLRVESLVREVPFLNLYCPKVCGQDALRLGVHHVLHPAEDDRGRGHGHVHHRHLHSPACSLPQVSRNYHCEYM